MKCTTQEPKLNLAQNQSRPHSKQSVGTTKIHTHDSSKIAEVLPQMKFLDPLKTHSPLKQN